MVAFVLQEQKRVVATETRWPTKPKIFAICPQQKSWPIPYLEVCLAQSRHLIPKNVKILPQSLLRNLIGFPTL